MCVCHCRESVTPFHMPHMLDISLIHVRYLVRVLCVTYLTHIIDISLIHVRSISSISMRGTSYMLHHTCYISCVRACKQAKECERVRAVTPCMMCRVIHVVYLYVCHIICVMSRYVT